MKISDWPRSQKLLDLAQRLVEESIEARAAIDEEWMESRRCVETTGSGERCKAFAMWDCPAQLCASHFHRRRGPVLTFEERQAKEKLRKRPTCDCPAYAWPHRPRSGLCQWPLDPAETHPTPAGGRSPGTLVRRKFRAALKRIRRI